jgi:anti-sigma factor RsiW
MSSCGRARDLFGAYWDDEVTQAEREWLEAHFHACSGCRTEYEQLAHTLEAVAALPREEAAPDLASRALAAARRASPAPDVIYVRESPRWVPVTAAAAAVLLVVASLAPYLARTPGGFSIAGRGASVPEARLVATRLDGSASGGATTGTAARGPLAASVVDSLFDHSEDVDFVLDPVSLRGGRAHTGARLPEGVQGEQLVITF